MEVRNYLPNSDELDCAYLGHADIQIRKIFNLKLDLLRLYGEYAHLNFCQSSSAVEQRTHKPLVIGSNPISGTTFLTARFSLFKRKRVYCFCINAPELKWVPAYFDFANNGLHVQKVALGAPDNCAITPNLRLICQLKAPQTTYRRIEGRNH